MKTLYESIIQSQFGDHKIEESILDNDAMNRMENDVQAHMDRKKIMTFVLNALGKELSNLKFDYDGSLRAHTDSYGLADPAVSTYRFIGGFQTPKDIKPSDVEMDLTQSLKKYEHNFIKTSNEDGILFTSRSVGAAIHIKMHERKNGSKTVVIELIVGQNDWLFADMVGKFIKKFRH